MDRPAAWKTSAIDLEAERPFRIGGASIDPVSRDAHYPSGSERLQPQHLKVLVALTHRKGEVVTRSELIDCCWGGRIVGEDVINRSISILRDFAGRAGGFTIETIPKAGYRLIANSKAKFARNVSFRRAATIILAAVATAILLIGLQWRTSTHPRQLVVALKPLTSSADPASRELAAGTGDALSHMMVAGSFHGKLAWPATAKDEAEADIILTGDIRRTGDSLAAVMQARDRRTRTVIFSRRYETQLTDADKLPEQIGAEISSNLTGVLALLVLNESHSDRPELTAEKLKSISITVSEDDPLAGYEISRRLAKTQPDALLAQLGVAYDTAFALTSLPRQDRPEAVRIARIAADKALRMAPEFGDTYAPWCLLHPMTQSRQCEDRLRAGMKADPDAPFTPVFLSSLLFNVGRFEESWQFARTGLAGDPFHPHKLRRVVRTLIILGQKEEADRLFSKAVRWWPNHEGLQWDRLHAFAITGDLAGAERAIDQLPPNVLERTGNQISAMMRTYEAGDRKGLRSLCLAPDADYLLQSFCLTSLHRIGDRSGAMQVADRLFPRAVGATERESEAIWLDNPYVGIEPMLSAPATAWLRLEPEFLNLAERTGALRYWNAGRLPDFCRKPSEPICNVLRKRS